MSVSRRLRTVADGTSRPDAPSTHTRSLREAAAELGKSIEDVTPVDLLAYEHEDLPDGRCSPLGGEVRNSGLRTRPESETRRLAEIGRKAVDDAVADKPT